MKNILFILTDDQGLFGLSCYGNNEIITPNIDELAKNGSLYSNFYCTSPVCSPARASIFTGTMPSEHGVIDWISGGNFSSDKLNDEQKSEDKFKFEKEAINYLKDKCFTEILKENDYKCGIAGKWHLGDSFSPQAGFDYWKTIPRGGTRYTNPEYCINNKFGHAEGYVTDLITDDALHFLDSVNEKFYLSVHYTAPHSPWDEEDQQAEIWNLYNDTEFTNIPKIPPNESQINTSPMPKNQEDRRRLIQGYYTTITAMDRNIGKLIDKLKERDIYDDTVIIFTSDNGFNLGHHGIWGKGNATMPFNMYDTSTKVPLIISNYKNRGNVDTISSQYDIFPSILDICDIPYKNTDLPGKSLFSLDDEQREIIVYSEYGPTRMIRDDEFKLVYNYPYGPHQLYNLESDPDEIFNLVDLPEYNDTKLKLLSKMSKWFEKYTKRYDARVCPVDGFGQVNTLDNFEKFKDDYN